MGVPNINGGWLSEHGQLVYTITQVDDKFVRRVTHTNGVTETGIGWFPNPNEEDMSTAVAAQWNFHGGDLKADSRRCPGTVIIVGGKATEIQWTTGTIFSACREGQNFGKAHHRRAALWSAALALGRERIVRATSLQLYRNPCRRTIGGRQTMLRYFTLEYWVDDGSYIGRLTEVPGVFSQGETLLELEENIGSLPAYDGGRGTWPSDWGSDKEIGLEV